MRILVFSHNYSPEGNALASRFSAMCAHWTSMGHEVQVITCTPNFPTGAVFDGYKNKFVQHETIDSVEVTRVWTYMTPNKGRARRVIGFVVYMVMAVWISLFQKRPDVIIGSSPQFFAAWAGLISSRLRLRRIPFIAEIRDLWPDSIVAVGALGNRAILAFIYWLEKLLYKHAAHIVTVGSGYLEDLLGKGIPENKISIIPNGADAELFPDVAPDKEFRQRYDLDGRISCAYVGTIGMAAGLGVVLDVAGRLKEHKRNDIVLFLIGDGAERASLQVEAERRGLDNLVFTGMIPKTKVPGILAAMDICFVHLKKQTLFTRVLPSKIFEATAMGKPIILGVEGCAAELIREANAGICIEPENAGEFHAALDILSKSPDTRKRLGENGRRHVTEHYDRKTLSQRYVEILSALITKAET